MFKILTLLMSLIITLHLNGCAYQRIAFGHCSLRVKTADCFGQTPHDADLLATSYAAVDALLDDPTLPQPLQIKRFLATTVADLDDLDDTTSLGRLIGEQLSARLAQRGYAVLEPKLQRHSIMITPRGEFALSRAGRDLLLAQHADAVITGTYTVGKDTVYVTLKMLEAKGGYVLSSFAYTLPLGPNTYALLQKFWEW